MYLLFLLFACGGKTAPDDAAFEAAREVVAAWERGEAQPQALSDELGTLSRGRAYLGQYLWEMQRSMAAARNAVGQSLSADARYSGLVFATPAPLDENCCFDVHFPAAVEGTLKPWVTVTAGWDGAVHRGLPESAALPEPGEPNEDWASRARLFEAASESVGKGFEPGLLVALRDLTQGEDPEVFAYFQPTLAPDTVQVGGVSRWTWARPDATPTTQLIGGPARSWPRASLEGPSGVFVMGTGSVPDEALVWASSQHTMPLWVELETGLWRVEGSAVGLVGLPR